MGCVQPSVVAGQATMGALVGRAGPGRVGSEAMPCVVVADPLQDNAAFLCVWLCGPGGCGAAVSLLVCGVIVPACLSAWPRKAWAWVLT